MKTAPAESAAVQQPTAQMFEAFETKYCERCGRLALRPCGSRERYCSDCTALLEELPPATAELGAREHPPKVTIKATVSVESIRSYRPPIR